MPRFFFNTADSGRDTDTDGVELADLASARAEGIRYAGASLAQEPHLLWGGHDFRVEVLDERRTLLFTIITLAVNAPAGDDVGMN